MPKGNLNNYILITACIYVFNTYKLNNFNGTKFVLKIY